MGNPALLFLDEPTTGLDPEGRRTSWDVFRKLAAEGTTVILTTHYMDEAEALADHVAILARGRIVAAGTPETIGGRDMGAATIRFRLPDGVVLGELPVPAISDDGAAVQIQTDDELRVLHALTGWAQERNVRLTGLTVSRNTLEDVYLRLTRGEPDKPEPDAVEKMAAGR